MASRKRLPPLAHLQGVLMVLDNRTKQPAANVLATVRDMVQDAISVLMEPDPLKQKIGFVLLAIQQSTEVRASRGHTGKVTYKVKVVDQPLYSWAMHEVHSLSANGKA